MKQYGLIGYPLSHSFSPDFFNKKFKAENIDAQYTAFPLATVSSFKDLLAAEPNLAGLNVTIPYKTSIIPFLDELSTAAEKIGAVNCIQFKQGRLIGHNTDFIGFADSLKPLLQSKHKRALILGTGGASKAVAYALNALSIPYQYVSSSDSSALQYAAINKKILDAHQIIINTTPLGMSPATDACPALPYHLLNENHLVYDLIYNPEQTKFLATAAAQGAQTKNGAEMLYLQAEKSWDIWQS
jgi:shikimate dehydrogenase